jgi:sRNA-binding protein
MSSSNSSLPDHDNAASPDAVPAPAEVPQANAEAVSVAQAADVQATAGGDASEGSDGAAAATPAPAAKAEEMSPAAAGDRLKQLFPALFTGGAKPLKLRIQADIQERAPGVFTKAVLSAFLRRHTGATSYLIAVSKGTQRFDLDGQPAGELTEEHRKVAADELTRRRANQDARRAQEDAARREEDQARYKRASLLRGFETTKLTEANFCALKGITSEQLPELLALARKEAAERPPAPQGRPPHGQGRPRHEHGDQRRDERRGDRGGNRGGGHGGARAGEQRPGGDRRDTRGPRGDDRRGRPEGGGPRGDRDHRGGDRPRQGQAPNAQQRPQNRDGQPRGPRNAAPADANKPQDNTPSESGKPE